MGIYEKLGVKTLINAHDTLTAIGGSSMPQLVLEAMQEASKNFVDIMELNRKIGQRIAQLTRNEAAYITAGASSAVMLAAAVCMTGNDPYLMRMLPNTNTLKNEIIIQKCQRNGYDLVVPTTGAKVVEIGLADATQPWELDGAINENTAAVFYFASSAFQRGSLHLETIIEICRKRSVPVVVDAAAQLPPVENLWKFTHMGASLAIFSGGKTLRGPQCSGLLLGERRFIDACLRMGSPNHTMCRSPKVGREEMVGLLAAIDHYIHLDHEALNRHYEESVAFVIDELSPLTQVESVMRLFPGPVGQTYPRAKIVLRADFPRMELIDRLHNGEPGIEIGSLLEEENSVYVSPLNLQDGEIEIVIGKFKEILGK